MIKFITNLGISLGLFCLLVCLLTTTTHGQSFTKNTSSVVLMDAKTGQILLTKNEQVKHPPASLTKIMTLLVALKKAKAGEVNLDDKVKISQQAEEMGGSQIWLAAGDKISLRDLLKATLIPSANDACAAVAEYVGGTKKNFVSLMNHKAKELNLNQTHFVNSTGLPQKEHYSSAHDIAVITRKLITNHPLALKWSKIQVDRIDNGNKLIFTTNKLLGKYPPADGLQTGWTKKAGYCLVGTAKKKDKRLISVITGTKSKQARRQKTIKLLNHGFKVFEEAELIKAGSKIKEITIKEAEKTKVPVQAASNLSALVKRGTTNQIKKDIQLNKKLTAPLKKGEQVGKLVLTHPEYEIGQVPLVTARKVNRASIFTLFFRWLEELLMSPF